MMIPKKIHYCWLGGNPLPPLAKKCIQSWKKYCPDYEIICWNESNYDFTKHPYMKQALEVKKWGFVPDYARLDILYQHGGIYLDTDVELVKNIDDLLQYKFYAGFESEKVINLGLGFGAEAGHPLLKEMMDDYDNYSFIKEGGALNLTPSPIIQSQFLRKYGLKTDNGEIQIIHHDCYIFPQQYMFPKATGLNRYDVRPETYSIHHCAASWMPFKDRLQVRIATFFGHELTNKLRQFIKKMLRMS